jgi:hypothetical protein
MSSRKNHPRFPVASRRRSERHRIGHHRPARKGCTGEPSVGGSVRFDIDDSGTRVLITGRFLAIDRPHLLRFTWSASDWPDPTAATVVTVAFEPLGDDQTVMSIEPCCLHRNSTTSKTGGRSPAISSQRTCTPLRPRSHESGARQREGLPYGL